MSFSYKEAGVDIHAGNDAVKRIKSAVESTFTPQVLSKLGGFGAMYDLKPLLQHYHHPVLVQSIDGVGTKMMVAGRMQRFETVGVDLVSATANDIIVLGAKPLTLLDYIANDRLRPEIIEKIIDGMALACRENDIALVGGETAEMPGTYMPGEHDLVGVITGVLEKDNAITGENISAGDVVLGLPSNGLHTNGYSFARKLLFERYGYSVNDKIKPLTESLGDELLRPHVNYTRPILKTLEEGITIAGMAHITGGGLLENVPRILPQSLGVTIKKGTWPVLPIFELLQMLSKANDDELYRTFNMGVGMVLIVKQEDTSRIKNLLMSSYQMPVYQIGSVVEGTNSVRLI